MVSAAIWIVSFCVVVWAAMFVCGFIIVYWEYIWPALVVLLALATASTGYLLYFD